MKKQTVANLTAVITLLAAKGPSTVIELASELKLSTHQINALEGTWSHGAVAEGETAIPTAVESPLWTRQAVGGHTFLSLTEAGKTWKAPAAETKAKAAKPQVMDLEEARKALAAQLEVTKTNEVANEVAAQA